MNFINHPDLNMTMGAGEGNENTVSMRVMKLLHPGYESNPTFFAAPFEFDDQEKTDLKSLISIAMSKANTPLTSEMLDTIVNALPPIWLQQMHSWAPTILAINNPTNHGFRPVERTGIEMIQQERWEQINKHGFSLEHDKDYYQKGELVEAAKFCMSLLKDGPELENAKWPDGWTADPWVEKLKSKTDIGKLTVAGAFYLAEMQRGPKAYSSQIMAIAKWIDKLQLA